jgi:hypothetical protein
LEARSNGVSATTIPDYLGNEENSTDVSMFDIDTSAEREDANTRCDNHNTGEAPLPV